MTDTETLTVSYILNFANTVLLAFQQLNSIEALLLFEPIL